MPRPAGVDATTLRELCPFRLVRDEDLAQLVAETTVSEVPAGTEVYADGAAADGVAALVEGTVEVLKDGRVLGTLEAGAVLGEVALLVPGATRSATVRAASDVRLVTWRAGDVPRRLAAHEPLATAVVADVAHVLAERLDRRTQDVVSLLDVAGRRLPVSELERLRHRSVQ